MRKTGFLHTSDGLMEIIPKTYKFESLAHRRRLFLAMINFTLSKKAKFALNRYDFERENLKEIFVNKIFDFFQGARLRPESSKRVVRILGRESILFLQFFALLSHPRTRWLSRRFIPRQNFKINSNMNHPAAELILKIFNGKEIELMIDLDKLFRKVVYERIKLKNDPSTVSMDDSHIFIKNDQGTLRIATVWKSTGKDAHGRLHLTIKRELQDLDEAIDRCFIVVPKSDTFLRHTPVKTDRADICDVKVVPYSFTFCDFKRCKSRPAVKTAKTKIA